MIQSYEVGAVFRIIDEASLTLDKLARGFSGIEKQTSAIQAKFDKFMPAGFFASIEKADTALEGLSRTARTSAEGIVTGFGDVEAGLRPVFEGISTQSKAIFDSMPGMASGAADGIVSAMERATASVDASMASVRSLLAETKAASAEMASLSASSGNSMLATRRNAAHAVNNAHAGGIHFRGPSAHLPGGGHIGAGGDGMVPLVGGLALGDLVKTGIEHAFDFEHWASQYKAAGFSDSQIDLAKQAAWANAASNPNASATDSLRNILELNKATGSLEESMKVLPAFSIAETAMQSVKAEGLHSKFTGGTQTLNFARGLEELGVTQMGSSPEERLANIQRYTQELTRTMISSRGLFDGNALFAMTNNSGGAAQNWDMRMATVVAPILGDIMKSSKLGNADYMALRSYAGGTITSKAVEALEKYGLTGPNDTYSDSRGEHLKANSTFAAGMSQNIWDWSKGVLDKLQAHGIDITDQHAVNAVVNEMGSNKSTTMLMRAILEPLTRLQIEKEMNLRDRVPNDAAGILQRSDPVLKLDALHKKWDDFATALGGPLTDTAIQALTRMTTALTGMSQFMAAHPELTKFGGDMTAIAAGVLTLAGAVKMLGINVAAANAASGAKGGGAGAVGPIGKALGVFGVAEAAGELGALRMPKRTGVAGMLEFLDPGLADRLYGSSGGGLIIGDARAAEPFAMSPFSMRPADAGDRAMARDEGSSKSIWQRIFGANDNGGVVPVAFRTGGPPLPVSLAIGSDLKPLHDAVELGTFAGVMAALSNMGGGFGGGGGIMNASYTTFGGGSGGLGSLGGITRSSGGASYPGHIGGMLDIGGNSFRFGSGGVRGSASIPLGDYPITPGMIGAWGQSHGALGINGNQIWDKTLGRMRAGIELHPGAGTSLITEGCVAFLRQQWPEVKDRILSMVHRYGHAYLHVGKDGASITPYAGAPPKTVTPGAPAAAGQSAMNLPPIHVHVTHVLDGKKLAETVTKHVVSNNMHPRSVGGPDRYGQYQHPGTDAVDAA